MDQHSQAKGHQVEVKGVQDPLVSRVHHSSLDNCHSRDHHNFPDKVGKIRIRAEAVGPMLD